ALEPDRDLLRLVRGILRARDELEDVVRGRLVQVLDAAALGGAAPEVVVDRVRGNLGPALPRDALIPPLAHLFLPSHLPLPPAPPAPPARGRGSASPARGSRSSFRSDPGRSPCRCSRGRSCRSHARARLPRRAPRSTAGRAL